MCECTSRVGVFVRGIFSGGGGREVRGSFFFGADFHTNGGGCASFVVAVMEGLS